MFERRSETRRRVPYLIPPSGGREWVARPPAGSIGRIDVAPSISRQPYLRAPRPTGASAPSTERGVGSGSHATSSYRATVDFRSCARMARAPSSRGVLPRSRVRSTDGATGVATDAFLEPAPVTTTPERSNSDQCLGAWCPGEELNHRHRDFQSRALPTELPGRRPRIRDRDASCLASRTDLPLPRTRSRTSKRRTPVQ